MGYRPSMHARSVVVTGIGIACPLGTDVETVARGQREGWSGAGPLAAVFDTEGFPVETCCRVPSWDLAERLGVDVAGPLIGRIDRKAELGFYAAVSAMRMAFHDDASARLAVDEAPERVGCHLASGLVGTLVEEAEGNLLPHIKPDGFDHAGSFDSLEGIDPVRARHYTDRATHLLAGRYPFRGPSVVNHGACAAGAVAIGTAMRWIRSGRCDMVIAGGFESMIHPFGVLSFQLLGALTERADCPHEEKSRPFDRTRSGFVIGEGAAALVLEAEDKARVRGAVVLGRVLGFGSSLDSHRTTAPPPDGRGAALAMRLAQRDAGVDPRDIRYVNAHGTGTELNDVAETRAIHAVFRGATEPPVSSSKSAIGHTIAAAGAVEASLCLLAMRDGLCPATLNLRHPDPLCDLDHVALVPRAADLPIVQSNSFGFGGVNASLVLGRGDAGS
jgi:3-oxoacyl-[acyl-carrier-protein] synthase II